VHWGWLLRADQIDQPLVVQSFLDASKAAVVASGVLSDWHHIVVGLNLDDMGAATRSRPRCSTTGARRRRGSIAWVAFGRCARTWTKEGGPC
jgi:hypothetical protein